MSIVDKVLEDNILIPCHHYRWHFSPKCHVSHHGIASENLMKMQSLILQFFHSHTHITWLIVWTALISASFLLVFLQTIFGNSTQGLATSFFAGSSLSSSDSSSELPSWLLLSCLPVRREQLHGGTHVFSQLDSNRVWTPLLTTNFGSPSLHLLLHGRAANFVAMATSTCSFCLSLMNLPSKLSEFMAPDIPAPYTSAVTKKVNPQLMLASNAPFAAFSFLSLV